jgi:small GTP-binding protein
MSSSASAALEFKIITLGDSNVGKTTLIKQYAMQMRNRFKSGGTTPNEMKSFQNTRFGPTVGVDFEVVLTKYDQTPIRIVLWDTSGQERYAPITRNYCRDSKAVLLVFDLTKRSSFQNLTTKWFEIAKEETSSSRYSSAAPVIAMIGNKNDILSSERQVSYEEAAAFARLNCTPSQCVFYVEISAKENDNVIQTIDYTIQLIMLEWKKKISQSNKRATMTANTNATTTSSSTTTMRIPYTITEEVWQDLLLLNQEEEAKAKAQQNNGIVLLDSTFSSSSALPKRKRSSSSCCSNS